MIARELLRAYVNTTRRQEHNSATFEDFNTCWLRLQDSETVAPTQHILRSLHFHIKTTHKSMMTPPVPTTLEAAASIPSPCPSEEGHAGQAGSGHTLKDKATGNGNPISPLFRQSLAEYRSKMPRREQVEDARLARLGEAADYPDGFFLMLHQVLCLNTWDCAKLSMNVSISPKTRNGMLLASALLDPANTVRYEFFQHFSSFPMDFVTLLKTETNFQLMISHLPTCLNAISDSLHNLRVTLERRRTPPLVRYPKTTDRPLVVMIQC